MKKIWTIGLLLIGLGSKAQTDTTIQYVDIDYNVCPKDSAEYIAKTFLSKNGRWHKIYLDSKTLDSVQAKLSNSSAFDGEKDTSIIYGKRLNEYFSKEGNLTRREFFSKNGNRLGSSLWDSKNKILEQKGWNEEGKEIPKYVYFKEAVYPGGAQGWLQYMTSHFRSDVAGKNNAPSGRYTVVLHFLVNKDGTVSDVEAENDPGYGTVEEAIRTIKYSGKWLPAIQNNEQVRFLQRQQVTSVVN